MAKRILLDREIFQVALSNANLRDAISHQLHLGNAISHQLELYGEVNRKFWDQIVAKFPNENMTNVFIDIEKGELVLPFANEEEE